MFRGLLFIAAISGACSCGPAQAQSSSQTLTLSSQRNAPPPFQLFDTSLGHLDSVLLTGTVSWSGGVQENIVSLDNPYPAVNASISGTTSLGIYVPGGAVGAGPIALLGMNVSEAGQQYGSATLSGAVDVLLTGIDIEGFSTSQVGPSAPTGSIAFGALEDNNLPWLYSPGSPNGSYSLQLTYNYSNYSLPEPGTWAMMLIGLGAIGTVVRKRSSRTSPA